MKLTECLGTERVVEKCKGLIKHGQANGLTLCQQRVAPRPDSADFHNMSFLPQFIKDSHMMPESTSSFGAPWLLRNMPGSPRFGANVWPCLGSACIVVQLKGPAFYMVWPISWSATVNVLLEDSWSFACGMGPKEFDEFWVKAPVSHVVLEDEEALWVPYGHAVAQVSLIRPTQQASVALVMPYLSTQLLSKVNKTVIKAIAKSTRTALQERPASAMLIRYGAEYLAWLNDAIGEEGHEGASASGFGGAGSSSGPIKTAAVGDSEQDAPARDKEKGGMKRRRSVNVTQPLASAEACTTPADVVPPESVDPPPAKTQRSADILEQAVEEVIDSGHSFGSCLDSGPAGTETPVPGGDAAPEGSAERSALS